MTVVSAKATATHGPLVLTTQLRRDICQWDVGNWSRALDFWNCELSEPWDGLSALELGAGRGGLSAYFALRGCQVTCTDLKDAAENASSLHGKYGCAGQVTYAAADATAIPFSDDTFDFVAFKSLLGTVGRRGGKAGQQQACDEIHRVLKPGGALLFAENLSGAAFHAFCRRKFVPWGGGWRYITIAETNELLGAFGNVRYRAFGVLALFGRAEWQRTALHYADLFLSPLAPEHARYMIYGIAKK
jgi:SAM-dependent methyltransferase